MEYAKRETSFGALETLLRRDEKIVAEVATFTSTGKSHVHDQWEICYVLSGDGYIHVEKSDDKVIMYTVTKGDVVKIPPYTGHWMSLREFDKTEMEILLVYSDSE